VRIFVTVLFLVFGGSAIGGQIWCEGKIDNSYISSDGDVLIKGKWRSHYTKICNTKDQDVVTCSLWASYVTSAVQNNLKATLYYNLVDDTITCANLPTYLDSPRPRYIMIHNPGSAT